MIWSPKSRTHMVKWQMEHGSDPAIAKAASESTGHPVTSEEVRRERRKWKVDAFQPKRDEIRTFLSDEEIDELYAGRRYVDWDAVPILERNYRIKTPSQKLI